jgi:hypothetical protein
MQSLHKNLTICIKYNAGQISEPINTNKEVRQVSGLFNVYINKAIKEWKQTTQNGIQLTIGK